MLRLTTPGASKTPRRWAFTRLDARTVRVELNNPTAFFLDLCAFQTLSVVPRQVIARDGEQWLRANPLPTSGPYLLDAWRLNYKVRLRKNPFTGTPPTPAPK
jgi:ABC-type oligopeptide transport system substrate-binding subunit